MNIFTLSFGANVCLESIYILFLRASCLIRKSDLFLRNVSFNFIRWGPLNSSAKKLGVLDLDVRNLRGYEKFSSSVRISSGALIGINNDLITILARNLYGDFQSGVSLYRFFIVATSRAKIVNRAFYESPECSFSLKWSKNLGIIFDFTY